MHCETIYLYEDRKDVTLKTYIIDDSAELLNGKARPAIIICPGGAYLNCSDREAEPVALRFAAMGYHAFVLRYSTYFEGKDDGWSNLDVHSAPKPFTQFPHPMQEIGQAMLILRDHADAWHLDADQISICGFSAGAHNCAMYSVYWDSEYMTEHFHRPVSDFKPATCILSYTLSDYCFMKNVSKGTDPMAEDLFALSNIAIAGQAAPSDEMLKALSPAQLVTKNTPPTFLWATAADELVPVQHSYLMALGLAKAGVPHELHVFENGPHGYSLADESCAGAKSQISRDASAWIGLAEKFIKRHTTFPLPEKTPFEVMLENNK